MEAFNLYIHVVRASQVSPRRFVRKAALVAWGEFSGFNVVSKTNKQPNKQTNKKKEHKNTKARQNKETDRQTD